MTRPIPIARPNFTDPTVDWLPWQVARFALPAVEAEIRTLNRYKQKMDNLLDEKHLTADQRAELTFILDQLFKKGIIQPDAELYEGRGEGGKFISGEDHVECD